MAEFSEPLNYGKLIDQRNLGVSTGSTYPSDQRIKKSTYFRTDPGVYQRFHIS
jgi:hypothetical protein